MNQVTCLRMYILYMRYPVEYSLNYQIICGQSNEVKTWVHGMVTNKERHDKRPSLCVGIHQRSVIQYYELKQKLYQNIIIWAAGVSATKPNNIGKTTVENTVGKAGSAMGQRSYVLRINGYNMIHEHTHTRAYTHILYKTSFSFS